MTLREIIHDAVCRIVNAASAIEDGDTTLAHTLLLDLEVDLNGALAKADDDPHRLVTLDDFNSIARPA